MTTTPPTHPGLQLRALGDYVPVTADYCEWQALLWGDHSGPILDYLTVLLMLHGY